MFSGSSLTPSQIVWLNRRFYSAPFKNGEGQVQRNIDNASGKSGKKIDNLISVSNKVIFRARAVFPFDFFPDEITIDVNQVNILYNHFLSKRVHSIAIKNILDVSVNCGILFASLQIIDVGYKGESPIEINYFRKKDAFEARQVIQGLVVSSKQDLDLAKVGVDKNKLEILGEATGIEESS